MLQPNLGVGCVAVSGPVWSRAGRGLVQTPLDPVLFPPTPCRESGETAVSTIYRNWTAELSAQLPYQPFVNRGRLAAPRAWSGGCGCDRLSALSMPDLPWQGYGKATIGRSKQLKAPADSAMLARSSWSLVGFSLFRSFAGRRDGDSALSFSPAAVESPGVLRQVGPTV